MLGHLRKLAWPTELLRQKRPAWVWPHRICSRTDSLRAFTNTTARSGGSRCQKALSLVLTHVKELAEPRDPGSQPELHRTEHISLSTHRPPLGKEVTERASFRGIWSLAPLCSFRIHLALIPKTVKTARFSDKYTHPWFTAKKKNKCQLPGS